jgi:glyceraldehyde 3-phosphate dehydrogenase
VTQVAINEVVRTAAASAKWRGILHYEDDPIVSSDIIRSTYSSTFDSQATMVQKGNVSKTLAWYDNGWGYTHRVVDLIRKFVEIDKEAA